MFPRFAPVAPIHILEQLHTYYDLQDYHLVLTHDVLKQKERFHRLFSLVAQAYKNTTVIVDNSVIELGRPVPAHEIREAGEVFKSAGCQTVIVLPDELLDAPKTIELVEQGLYEWKPYDGDFGFMFVPQGKTLVELIQCAEKFAGRHEITHIGIARNITEKICGSRKEATQLLQILFPHCTFHLLGFSDSIADDVLCSRLPGVAGIDSAVPLRIKTRLELSGNGYEPRGDWWDTVETLSKEQFLNIRRFRNWITCDPY